MKEISFVKISASISVLTGMIMMMMLTISSQGIAMVGQSELSLLYNSKCALCHAKDGAGTSSWKAKGQPDFKDAQWQKSRSDAQIADGIRNGRGKFMPAFKSKLTEEQINGLVRIVRGFGKK